MALPPLTHQFTHKLLTEFCLKRTPPEIQANVRVGFEIRGNTITISEHRLYFMDATAPWTNSRIAVLVYDDANRAWDLFAFNRNSCRMPYDVEPTRDLAVLIAEIDADPTGIFWRTVLGSGQ